MSTRTYSDGMLTEEWDDDQRVYRRYDGTGLVLERTYTAAEVDALVAPSLQGSLAANALLGVAGRRYKVVAGVLRNAGGPSHWQPITDNAHQPTFIDSVSTSTTGITINHAALAATKVAALIVVPDETLAAAGITAGVSVGLTSSVITLQRQGKVYSDYVSYNGSAWTSNSGVFTGIAYVGGVLHLVHPALPVPDAFGCSISPRGGAHQVTVNGVSTTYLDIEFRNWSGALITTAATTMQAYVTRGGHTAALNPQTVDTTAYPGSNLWVLGVFETA